MGLHFENSHALVDRLAAEPREIVLLFGAALTSPRDGVLGVPGTSAMIARAREALREPAAEKDFDDAVRQSTNAYQTAFEFVHARRGQSVINDIVYRAVLQSRLEPDKACSVDEYERDLEGWMHAPGLDSVGHIIASLPKQFGRVIMTSNFDPLIEIGIRRAGGRAQSAILHADGEVHLDTEACQVVHFHGYWVGADTLHTPNQLRSERPSLQASLMQILKDRLLAVFGYGGWDDIFAHALQGVLHDPSSRTEVAWAFYEKESEEVESRYRNVLQRLAAGIARGRVALYRGIDLHEFFPNSLESRLDRRFTHGETVVADGGDKGDETQRLIVSSAESKESSEIFRAPTWRPIGTRNRWPIDMSQDPSLLVTNAIDPRELGKTVVCSRPVRIGRTVDFELSLSSVRVSRDHACVERRLGNWFVRDNRSANGTSVNGVSVSGPHLLKHADRIELPGFVIEFIRSQQEAMERSSQLRSIFHDHHIPEIKNRTYFDRMVTALGLEEHIFGIILLCFQNMGRLNEKLGAGLVNEWMRYKFLPSIKGTVPSSALRPIRYSGATFALICPRSTAGEHCATMEALRNLRVEQPAQNTAILLSVDGLIRERGEGAAEVLRRCELATEQMKARRA